jgi:putative nucleotidyltransferase with HDIG domain
MIQLFLLSTGIINGAETSLTVRIVHILALVIATGYVLYTQYQLWTASKLLGLQQNLFEQAPCGVGIINKDTSVAEANEVYNKFVGYDGVADGNNHRAEVIGGAFNGLDLQYSQEVCDSERNVHHLVHHVRPIVINNKIEYAAEFISDITIWVQRFEQTQSEYLTMLKILVNMFEMKDPYSQGHSETVSNLSQEIARHMGLTEREVEVVGRAALLHDIGKIIIPSEILNKTGPLTAADYAIIRRHPDAGADILQNMNVFRDIVNIVRYHHERYDGSGYPEGLVGESIPLGARILAVADAFEAMTAGRSSHGKRDTLSAMDELKLESSKQVDPEIVAVFTKLVDTGRIINAAK